MTSLQRFRKFLLTMSLAALLATATAFYFGSTESWAATPIVDAINLPQSQLLAMNQVKPVAKKVEAQAQAAIGKMTDDPKAQAVEKAKQLKAQTLEGLDRSIGNSNQQSAGKNTQAGKAARESEKQMEAEARAAFK